jgi:hypothetical protein
VLGKILRKATIAFPPNPCSINYQAINSNTPAAKIFYVIVCI